MTSSKSNARQDNRALALASSREVKQGWLAERIVKSALEGMAEQINGPRAMLNHIEHDPATMPLLKITEAQVVPDGDEFLLIACDCIADDITKSILRILARDWCVFGGLKTIVHLSTGLYPIGMQMKFK